MSVKKLELKQKVEMAWFKATGQDDGWAIFLSMIYKDSQEAIANKFKVSYRTSQRWHDEYKRVAA